MFQPAYTELWRGDLDVKTYCLLLPRITDQPMWVREPGIADLLTWPSMWKAPGFTYSESTIVPQRAVLECH